MQMRIARMLAERDEWPMEAYGTVPYVDRDKPTVFWGAYDYDLRAIEAHTGRAVIVWRGNDLLENGHRLDLWRREGWTHIATSRWHETELFRLHLPHERRNLPGRDLSNFTYASAGPKIFYYSGDGETYGDEVFTEVQDALPEESFIHVLGWYNHTRGQIRALMSESWLGLRLRSFDGPASTVLEMASMGRRSVFNGDTPGAIPWADAEEVVTIIKNAKREADPGLPYALRDWLTLDRGWYQ